MLRQCSLVADYKFGPQRDNNTLFLPISVNHTDNLLHFYL
jgi:hypothetical protein